MAVGILGEDWQRVRFCEHVEDDANDGTNGGDSSSRERMDRRMDAGCWDDFDADEGGERGSD
eukprot:CAMPEP_0172538346 /NCGR_PEP_ID=MMETSP1067-20121228/9742_1 /TAXON_ID=265564 ORGANISM="Thalassiosira punctigera, Strain Tpunct2005C2" /NCGR_SAMPLE_ID=MMETSP1067 /ASSEMBLY_ACC=CAM_ASM_000444 /LENGTH=61 /DNA_ID=CAMNT_0013323821 /DNA_START=24 /DNA_END=206 /DNA_ORIENTATION=+